MTYGWICRVAQSSSYNGNSRKTALRSAISERIDQRRNMKENRPGFSKSLWKRARSDEKLFSFDFSLRNGNSSFRSAMCVSSIFYYFFSKREKNKLLPKKCWFYLKIYSLESVAEDVSNSTIFFFSRDESNLNGNTFSSLSLLFDYFSFSFCRFHRGKMCDQVPPRASG